VPPESFLLGEKDSGNRLGKRKIFGCGDGISAIIPIKFINEACLTTISMDSMTQTTRSIGIIAILLVTLLATGCLRLLSPPGQQAIPVSTPSDGRYHELTEEDPLAIPHVLGTDISVHGVHLGSSMADAIERLGKPDAQTSPAPDTFNFEYNKALNTSKTALLVHFDKDIATRITVKRPFNPFLHGETVINHTKEDLYRLFSKPDKIQLLSTVTVYSYYDQGIDAIMDGPHLNGWSFTYPQPEKARENTG